MFGNPPAIPRACIFTWLARCRHSGSRSEVVFSEGPLLTAVYAHQGPLSSQPYRAFLQLCAGPDVVCTRASGARVTCAKPRNWLTQVLGTLGKLGKGCILRSR